MILSKVIRDLTHSRSQVPPVRAGSNAGKRRHCATECGMIALPDTADEPVCDPTHSRIHAIPPLPDPITPATLGLDAPDDLDAILQAGTEHLWLHASPWQALTQQPDRRLLVQGKGCTVTDIQGRSYLDGLSGQWLVNVGHGRAVIAEAM